MTSIDGMINAGIEALTRKNRQVAIDLAKQLADQASTSEVPMSVEIGGKLSDIASRLGAHASHPSPLPSPSSDAALNMNNPFNPFTPAGEALIAAQPAVQQPSPNQQREADERFFRELSEEQSRKNAEVSARVQEAEAKEREEREAARGQTSAEANRAREEEFLVEQARAASRAAMAKAAAARAAAGPLPVVALPPPPPRSARINVVPGSSTNLAMKAAEAANAAQTANIRRAVNRLSKVKTSVTPTSTINAPTKPSLFNTPTIANTARPIASADQLLSNSMYNPNSIPLRNRLTSKAKTSLASAAKRVFTRKAAPTGPNTLSSLMNAYNRGRENRNAAEKAATTRMNAEAAAANKQKKAATKKALKVLAKLQKGGRHTLKKKKSV